MQNSAYTKPLNLGLSRNWVALGETEPSYVQKFVSSDNVRQNF